MKIRESMSRRVFLVVNTIMLALIGFACFAPMWHVLCCSISDHTVLAREGGFHLWPVAPFSLAGYQAVLSYRNIAVGYMNTIFYVVVGTALNLALTIVAAYVLSRKRFLPGRVIMLLLTFTMLFNGGLIPTYLVYVRLGLINTRLAVLVPVKNGSRATVVTLTLAHEDAAIKPLPMTPAQVALIGNVMMGQRYGWGGMFGDRDCSALTRELLTPFGIWLPRNSLSQARSGRRRARRVSSLSSTPMAAPASTSVGKCTPTYSRDSAIRIARTSAGTPCFLGARRKIVQAQVSEFALCPEGKEKSRGRDTRISRP